MAKRNAKTTAVRRKPMTDGLAIMRRRHIDGDPARVASVQAEMEKLALAEKIYALRTSMNLNQRQFAKRVGMKEAAVSRLERADYRSHSLRSLLKIAVATGSRVSIDLILPKVVTPRAASPA